jgi:hypothetical protein
MIHIPCLLSVTSLWLRLRVCLKGPRIQGLALSNNVLNRYLTYEHKTSNLYIHEVFDRCVPLFPFALTFSLNLHFRGCSGRPPPEVRL